MVKLVVDNPSPPVTRQRRAILAKVHIAKKQLGLSDDDYRAILARITGEESAKHCTDRQLTEVITEFGRLGFDAQSRPAKRPKSDSAFARKARALWIGLHALGVIESGTEKALETFGKRQLGVERLQWADESHSSPLIEALKAMAERAGWEQLLPPRLSAEERGRILTERLVDLLCDRLAENGYPMQRIDCTELSLAQLHEITREFGARLRKAMGKS